MDLAQERVVLAPNPDQAGAAAVQDAVARDLVGRKYEVVDARRTQPGRPSPIRDEVAEVVEWADGEAHDVGVSRGSRQDLLEDASDVLLARVGRARFVRSVGAHERMSVLGAADDVRIECGRRRRGTSDAMSGRHRTRR